MDGESHASDDESPITVSSDFEKLIDSVTSDGEWTDILENKQLLKQTLQPGDLNGERPQRSNKVTVTVKSKLLGHDGDDSLVASECLQNAEIFVSEYDVMHGVDLAIPLMYPGETARVLIHPRFGYSGAGKEPDVPPNAAFDCEITLHSVEYVECETGLPIEDRIKFATAKKEKGNFWFTRNEYSSAIACYRRAVEFADAEEEEMKYLETQPVITSGEEGQELVDELKGKIKQLIELRATAYNNLAAAQMKVEAYEQALKSVNSSLQVNAKNVKALYRKSKILAIQGDLVESIESLKAAIALEPSSRSLQAELSRLAAQRKQELVKERKLYQKMLQVTPESRGDSETSSGNKSKVDVIKDAIKGGRVANWTASALRSTAAAVLVLVLSIVSYRLYTGSSFYSSSN